MPIYAFSTHVHVCNTPAGCRVYSAHVWHRSMYCQHVLLRVLAPDSLHELLSPITDTVVLYLPLLLPGVSTSSAWCSQDCLGNRYCRNQVRHFLAIVIVFSSIVHCTVQWYCKNLCCILVVYTAVYCYLEGGEGGGVLFAYLRSKHFTQQFLVPILLFVFSITIDDVVFVIDAGWMKEKVGELL